MNYLRPSGFFKQTMFNAHPLELLLDILLQKVFTPWQNMTAMTGRLESHISMRMHLMKRIAFDKFKSLEEHKAITISKFSTSPFWCSSFHVGRTLNIFTVELNRGCAVRLKTWIQPRCDWFEPTRDRLMIAFMLIFTYLLDNIYHALRPLLRLRPTDKKA